MRALITAVMWVGIAGGCGPASPDLCSSADRCGDGLDNDCDGSVDEGCACSPGELQACGAGACTGQQVCEAGTWSTCFGADPELERCDGVDNDCDGLIDNGDNACGGACELPGVPGQPCDGDDGDACREGTWSCGAANSLVCSDTTGTLVELCDDGTDNNCDGRTDEYCALATVRWADHGGSPDVGAAARALDLVIARDGSVYVVGSHDHAVTFGGTASHDAGARRDAFIVKYSATGQLVWHRAITGAGDAEGAAIAIAPDDTVVVAGTFGNAGPAEFAPGVTRTPLGGSDGFVARYSAAGGLLGVTTFASDNEEVVDDVAVSASGAIAVTGKFVGATLTTGGLMIPRAGFGWTYYVIALAADLTPQWVQRAELAAPATGDVEGTALAWDDTGGLVVGGKVSCFQQCAAPQLAVARGGADESLLDVSASLRAGFIARFTATGSLITAQSTPQIGGIATAGNDVFITGSLADTQVLALGAATQTTLVAQGLADAWLGHFVRQPDGTLAHQWSQRFGSPTSCGGFFVGTDDAGLAIAIVDGAPVVTGTHMLGLELAPDLTLAGDGWGNIFWAGFARDGALSFGHNGKIGEMPCAGGGTARGIAVAPNGDIAIAGDFTDHVIFPTTTLAGTHDFFVAVFAK